MTEKEEKRLMVKVAELYYHGGWTQAQISKKIGMSRPIVARTLHRAKEYGIVKVSIRDEAVHTVELERQLEEEYGIKEAVVVPVNTTNSGTIKAAVALAGANYVSRRVRNISRLGISWGTTLAQMVQQYPLDKRENIKVVPLEGGIGRNHIEIHSNHLAYELSKKMQGICSYLYAPAIMESAEMKEKFLQLSDIRSVLEEGESTEVAVIGIGNPFYESTLQQVGYLQNDDLNKLRKAGAVGDIGFRFFDKSGKAVNHPLNEKVVGLSLEQLKRIPLVIAITEGTFKKDSIIGVLKAGLIDVLVIDEPSAVKILEETKLKQGEKTFK